MQQPTPASPKRKRGHASIDTSDPAPVAKHVREGGDIDLGMLDQEAFARVIASGQQQQPTPIEPPSKDADEDEEEDGHDVVDDVTYHPSAVGLAESADPIWNLRLACLPVLDILVSLKLLYKWLIVIEYGIVEDLVFTSTFDNSSDCDRNSCISIKSQLHCIVTSF